MVLVWLGLGFWVDFRVDFFLFWFVMIGLVFFLFGFNWIADLILFCW